MLDIRLDCTVARLCPEGPLPIFNVDHRTAYAGGAANVALNALHMGGDVALLTALPHDNPLLPSFADLQLHNVPVADFTRKNRVFSLPDRALRARVDEDYFLTPEEQQAMLEEFKLVVGDYDIVVFSDYGKSALQLVDKMLALCAGKLTLVDPKGTAWWRYAGATYIKANAAECSAVTNVPRATVSDLRVQAIIRTAGVHGSLIHHPTHDEAVRPHAVNAVDPTGAGDSYLAAMAVALARGDSLTSACRAGSIAGALATTHVGTAIINSQEIDACLPAYLSNTTPQ